MTIDPWRNRTVLWLMMSVLPAASGCAAVCYDDGVLQDPNCPEGAEGSGSGPTEGGTETAGTAEGTGESGVMTMEGTAGDTADSSTGAPDCPGLVELLSPPTRTFEFVVEGSNFMTSDLDGISRFNAVAEVLLDMDGVVTVQQTDTRFGMMVYNGNQGGGCPDIASEPPQNNAAAPLAALMAMNPPDSFNAVPETIDAAVGELSADMAPGDKTIILIIGTEPGTCSLLTPMNAVELGSTRSATVDAVSDAFTAGFPTRVISVGGEVDTTFLQNLANEGLAMDPAPYYEVTTRAELEAAAAEITASSRECTFPIADPIPGELAPNCDVVVNGMAVGYEDADGWTLPDPQTLELQGAACDSIQSGLATINMTCECNG